MVDEDKEERVRRGGRAKERAAEEEVEVDDDGLAVKTIEEEEARVAIANFSPVPF